MPILKNPKHERFAQNLAKGMGQAEAYEAAGYRPSRASASTLLKHDPYISKRVAELLERRERIEETSTVRAIEKAALTKADVIAMLLEDRELARTIGKPEAAIKANELLGKELGMFIDRSESGRPGDFERMSTDELRDYVARGAGGAGPAAAGTSSPAGARGSGNPLGKPH